MKRKILSLLLCALMLAGIAVGCAKKLTPKESFFEIADSLKELTEGNFTSSLSIKLPADAVEGSAVTGILGDISNAKLDVSGSFSQKHKQFAAEVLTTISGSQGESSFKITDMLYDESGIYINFRTIFDLLMSFQGGKSSLDYSSIFTSDYLGITLEDLAELSGEDSLGNPAFDMANFPKYKALYERLYGGIKDSLKAEKFTADGGVYTLTLKPTDLIDIAKVVVGDMDANAGEYADVLLEIEANSPGYLDSIGIQMDGRSRDELIATVKAKSAEFSSSIVAASNEQAPDFTAVISLGKGKAKSYTVGVSFAAPEEELDVKVDLTLTGVAIEKITPPADYLTLDDIMSLFTL